MSTANLDIDPVSMERLGCSREALESLCKEYKIAELSVFGSIVRSDFRPDNSDIDFLVVYQADAKIDWVTLPQIIESLSALVKRKVDLVSKKWLPAHWHSEMVPAAKVIYALG